MNIRFSEKEASILNELGNHHYDGECKKMGKSIEANVDYDFDNRKIDNLRKLIEIAFYSPTEIGLIDCYSILNKLTLPSSNEIKRLKTQI